MSESPAFRETRQRGADGWVIETPELDADWDRARDLLRRRGLQFVNQNWEFKVEGRWFTPAELIAHLET